MAEARTNAPGTRLGLVRTGQNALPPPLGKNWQCCQERGARSILWGCGTWRRGHNRCAWETGYPARNRFQEFLSLTGSTRSYHRCHHASPYGSRHGFHWQLPSWWLVRDSRSTSRVKMLAMLPGLLHSGHRKRRFQAFENKRRWVTTKVKRHRHATSQGRVQQPFLYHSSSARHRAVFVLRPRVFRS